MLKYIIGVSFMLFCSFAYGQKVGIGTSDPTEILDVNGSIRARNLYTTPATEGNKQVSVNTEGKLTSKPLPPANFIGNKLLPGNSYSTMVSSKYFVPVLIKFQPNGAIIGYRFIEVDDIWHISIVSSEGISLGEEYVDIEILWINR